MAPNLARDTVTVTAQDLRDIAREAAERAARKVREDNVAAETRATVIAVLQELGLADAQGKTAEASYDLRDLRQFIEIFRMVKKRIAIAVVVIVVALLSSFSISHLRGWL